MLAQGAAMTTALVSIEDVLGSMLRLPVALANGTNDPHLIRDDFEGMGYPTIVMDLQQYSPANIIFESVSSGLRVDTMDGGTKRVVVLASGPYRDGDVMPLQWTMSARLPNFATDGREHFDILLDVRFRDVKIGHLSGATVTNLELAVAQFFSTPGQQGTVFYLQAYFAGARPVPNAIIGMQTDVRLRVVRHGTTETVPGRFVYYIDDVDQPDKFNHAYTGRYVEGITLGQNMSDEIHMERGTEGYLQWVDGIVNATQDTSGNEHMSAFATMCQSDFSYIWHGSDCGSAQLIPFPATWLTITKQLEGQFAETDRQFSFSVSLSDRPDPVTFSLRGGESHTIEGIAPDTAYEVSETPVAGYETAWENRTGTTVQRSIAMVTAKNRRKEAKVTLTKTSDWPELVTGHALYSLAGARFALTDETGRVWATPTSSADGSIATVTVPTGHTYTLAETSPSPGHRLPNPVSKSVAIPIEDESDKAISLQNPTIWQTLAYLASKTDADSHAASGQGDATDWSALRVEMEYYQNHDCSGAPSVVTRWAANQAGEVAFATATPTTGTWPWRRGGQNVLPLGSYRVREVQAPVGYRVNGTWQRRNVTENGIVNL